MSWSPAHHAVEQEDLPRLRDLLDAGADVEDDNGDGWTLLRHAIDVEYDGHAQSGEALHADVTAFLLARGADPLRPCNGMPVVEEAAIRGHWLAAEIMNAWISRGLMPTAGTTGFIPDFSDVEGRSGFGSQLHRVGASVACDPLFHQPRGIRICRDADADQS